MLGPFLRGGRDPAALIEARRHRLAHDPHAGRPADGAPASPRARTVDAAAWGPGACLGCWTRVPSLLGFEDDPTGLPGPASCRDPRWPAGAAMRIAGGCRAACAWSRRMVIAVLEQKVTGVQSRRGLGGPARRGRRRRTRADPAAHARLPRDRPTAPGARRGSGTDGGWRRRSRRRSCGVAGAAAGWSSARSCPASRHARRLCASLDGVGPWTVAETSQRALGDADAVSFGDYPPGRARSCYAFTGRTGRDGRADGRALLEPFAGHRYRVQRLVELAGITRPARGPRMTIADHRRSLAVSAMGQRWVRNPRGRRGARRLGPARAPGGRWPPRRAAAIAARQVERRAHGVGAEHRRRDPRGPPAVGGQGDHEVLHGGPAGDHEQVALVASACLVGIVVRGHAARSTNGRTTAGAVRSRSPRRTRRATDSSSWPSMRREVGRPPAPASRRARAARTCRVAEHDEAPGLAVVRCGRGDRRGDGGLDRRRRGPARR